MASYDFTGANGAPLPSGLTAINGAAEIQGNALAFTGAQPAAPRWLVQYARNGNANQQAVIRNTSSSSGIGRIYFRYVDTQNSIFAALSYSSQEIQIYSLINDSYTKRKSVSYALNADTDYTLLVNDDGSNISVSVNGSVELTDSLSTFASASSACVGATDTSVTIDDLDTDVGAVAPPVGEVAISEPPEANMVYQRNQNGEYTAMFAVTFTASPSSLSYRLINAANASVITNWTVFDSNPSGGTSTVSITRASSLIEYYVEVRDDDSLETAIQTVKWSVGAKVLIAGQSLAENLGNQGTQTQDDGVYKFGSANGFHKNDTGAGQNVLANRLAETLGCTAAIANVALTGTCLTEECDISQNQGKGYWNDPNGSLYTNLLSTMSRFAPDNRVEYVLWLQGGADANNSVDRDIFKADLEQFISRLRGDVSAKNGTSNTPIVITSLGGSAFATDEDRQDIREAIQEVTLADSLLLPIPVFPYATTDGTHPDDNGDRALGYTSVEIYNGASAPTIQNISMDGAEITVSFDQQLEAPAGNYSLEGVRVEVDGVSQDISSFAHSSGANTLITLSSEPVNASNVSVFINWGTRTTQGLLSLPKSLSNGLYAIPVISKNNDFSSAVNQPPVANAGFDQSIAAGATCILEGSASSDSDGTIASYSWRKVSGPTIALANANQAVASFIAPSESTIQTLVFELTVTDDDGVTSTDTVTVTVAAVPDVADPLDPTLSVISIKSKVGIEDDVQSFGVVSLYQYTDNFILCEVVSKSNAALSPDSFSQAEYRIVDNKGTNVVKLGLGTGIKEADGKFLIHINSGILNSSHKGSLKHQFVVWNQAGYKLPPIFGGTVNIIPVLEPTL